jgi:putative transcriptional regulator
MLNRLRRPGLRATFPALLLLAFCFLAPPVAAPEARFLVAARDLQDSNFAETVVLLVEQGTEGSWGLVINRPTTVKLFSLFDKDPFMRRRRDSLYYGGPVEPARLLILLQSAVELPGSRSLFEDVRLVLDPESLQALGDPEKVVLRVFAGYAGWAPGQLEAELTRGDWLIQPAEAAMVFSENPKALWQLLQSRQPLPVTQASPSVPESPPPQAGRAVAGRGYRRGTALASLR